MSDQNQGASIEAERETGELIAAAEKHAEAYNGDDRECIKTDVINAFYQGAAWQAGRRTPAAKQVGQSGVKTWEQRRDEDKKVQPYFVHMEAEIADLRAQLAQQGQDKPVARLQEEISDRPFSEGRAHFEIVILDRARCHDGMELYAAPASAQPADRAENCADRIKAIAQKDTIDADDKHRLLELALSVRLMGSAQPAQQSFDAWWNTPNPVHGHAPKETLDEYSCRTAWNAAAPQPAARAAVPDGWKVERGDRNSIRVIRADGESATFYGFTSPQDGIKHEFMEAMLAASPVTMTAPAQPDGPSVQKLHDDLDSVRNDYAILSRALAFWMPKTPEFDSPIADQITARIRHDAYYLTEEHDGKTAEELGWIKVAAPAAQQAAPIEPIGYLAGNASDGGEMMYYSREAAQRECDEYNAFERSQPDFAAENLRTPEPVYRATPATTGTVGQDAKDAALAEKVPTFEEWLPMHVGGCNAPKLLAHEGSGDEYDQDLKEKRAIWYERHGWKLDRSTLATQQAQASAKDRYLEASADLDAATDNFYGQDSATSSEGDAA